MTQCRPAASVVDRIPATFPRRQATELSQLPRLLIFLSAAWAVLAIPASASELPDEFGHKGATVEETVSFTNPYEGVAWETVGHYEANLHTHTNLSDGRHDPHYAIDRYHELGYHILALTDHDSLHPDIWPRPLYPWTELNAIYHEIKDEMSIKFDTTYAELADEEWQDRDPDRLGMVSIPGSEISRTNHIGSLFNDYAGGTRSEETAFREIGKRGGLAVFNHPGRYDRPVEWFVDYFQRHDHVVGMEVYNQTDRFPFDRRRWDSVLHRLMPDRPIWGLANDDTHKDAHFGLNRNVFLLTDFTQEDVFEAMKSGHFYFFVPHEQGTPPSVKLNGVEPGDDFVKLTIEGPFNRVEWVTYNPDTEESQILAIGPRISLDAIPPRSTFIRAVILSDDGRTYTQPFGIRRR